MLIALNQYFPLTHFANYSAHKIKANDLDCQFKLNQTLQHFRQPHACLWTYVGMYKHLHTKVDMYVKQYRLNASITPVNSCATNPKYL